MINDAEQLKVIMTAVCDVELCQVVVIDDKQR